MDKNIASAMLLRLNKQDQIEEGLNFCFDS